MSRPTPTEAEVEEYGETEIVNNEPEELLNGEGFCDVCGYGPLTYDDIQCKNCKRFTF